jgi:hypothetical protein
MSVLSGSDRVVRGEPLRPIPEQDARKANLQALFEENS